jgi:O-antigen ligase
LLLYSSAGTVVWEYLKRNQSDEALYGFTGRVVWWHYAWEQVTNHPLTGLGAYAGGKFGILAKLGSFDAAYLHSDWMEILVGTSFWGIITFAAAVLGTWWFLIKALGSSRFATFEKQLAVEAIGITGLLTLHSFFNDELSWHPPLLFLAVLGYAELLRRRGREQRSSLAFRPVPGGHGLYSWGGSRS